MDVGVIDKGVCKMDLFFWGELLGLAGMRLRISVGGCAGLRC